MILTELEKRVDIDRKSIRKLPEAEFVSLIATAQASYFYGLAASRAGEKTVSRTHYRKAFELLPTHIEALDNYAIDLVEDLQFAEAIPILEQSAYSEPKSPLAFLYLSKCYRETNQNRLAFFCLEYLKNNWPDKSPVIDWSHLGQPRPEPTLIAPPFSEGQVWKFVDSKECNGMRIWIRLIDLEQNGPVIHLSVVDNAYANQPDVRIISHLPFEAASLQTSKLELTDEQQLWDLENDHFGEGFSMWNEAFNAGEAGVFSTSLSEVVVEIFQQIKT